MGTNSQNQIDELVLVVHGVGDPKPGETLSLFARSVAETRHPLTEHQEILWLEDESIERRNVSTFGSHVRRLSFGGKTATLAEVYWGDLSRVNRGTLGIILGLIKIVFGLRYVAFVASHQGCKAAKSLQALGLLTSRIVHGPVLAVNFVLAAMMITVAGTETLWQGSSQNPQWTNLLVLCCVFVCLVSSLLGWQLTRNNVCHRFWFWVMVSGLFMNGLMMVNLYMDNECALLTYCRILVVLLGAQWITLVIVLAGMFVCWGLAQFNSKNYRPALNVALVLPAIAIGFWGQMLPIVWMTGSKTLNNAIPVAVSDSTKMQPLTLATTKDSIGGNSSTNPLSSKILPERFDLLFDEAVPLLGVQFLMALILGVMLIANLARYIRWSKKMTVDDFIGGRRAPRLIVSDSIQLLVGNFALIGVALVFYLAWHELNGQSYRETWLGTVLAEANKYAMGALVPIGGILVLSIHYLRPALDIILDVVNHFYFRPATDPDENENKNEDFDIVEASFDSEQLYFSRRDAIHRRLKRILEYYRSTIEGRPALTVISHSQGSMVAIEVFNDNELAWVNEKFSQVNFITMGSPFHHIYQNYFGHLYPSIDNRFWDNLRSRVGRWLNIFRIDDYVGTDIEFPETLREVHRGDYSNHAVEQKGHQLYWCDRQVLSIMREHRICRSLSAGLNDETRKAA